MPPSPHLLLTGGAGYIGSICAHLLSKCGFKITVLDNLSGGATTPKIGDFILGDVRNSELLETVFKNHSFDAVLHFAGKIQVGESVHSPLSYYDNNVIGTIKLLEAMQRHKVMNLVFSSTAAVYGTPQYLPIDETHPISPLSPYGSTKAIAEQLIQECSDAYGINSIILRYFNAAGAIPSVGLGESHVPETHFIPLLILSYLKAKKPFQVYGNEYNTPDGSCIRDYIHVCDLADAHIQALYALQNGRKGVHTYNLGTGHGYSVLEVISHLEAQLECSIPHVIAPPRKGDPPILVTDFQKAQKELQWTPSKDINEILMDAYRYIQRNNSGLK